MDLPGVGQNLQDHITANVEYRNRPTREIPIAASSNIGEGDGFIKTRLGLPAPDVQLILALVPYVDDAGRFTSSIRYAIGATLLHPESRGSITLVSKDPTASPAIQPNYLTSEADRQVLLEGFKIARKVGQAEAINPFCDLELQPGIWSQSDDALCAYIRERRIRFFIPSVRVKWAVTRCRLSMIGCKCMVCRVCASWMRPSCPRLPAATPTRRSL